MLIIFSLFLPPAYVVWREGTVFTGVCLLTFRGGGTWSQIFGGGVPGLRFLGEGVPGLRFSGGVPGLRFSGGVPGLRFSGGVPSLRFSGGGTWSQKIAMATRRAVCLLRSRRRTFLFYSVFLCTWIFGLFNVLCETESWGQISGMGSHTIDSQQDQFVQNR